MRSGEGEPSNVKRQLKDVRSTPLKLIHRHDGPDPGRSPASRLPIIAAVIGIAVLVALAGRSPRGGVEPEAQAAVPGQGSSMALEYFPAQYVNQATEVEEPIPTF